MSNYVMNTLRANFRKNQSGKILVKLVLLTAILTTAVITIIRGQQAAITPVATGGSPSPTDGLAAWWKLDEATGITLDDSSGNHLTAELAGNAPPAWVINSTDGVALRFAGADGFAMAPGSGSLAAIGEQLTISAWVKPSPLSDGTIVDTWVANNVTGSYALSLSKGHVAFDLMLNGSEVVAEGRTALNDGQWHHVSGVYDGSQVQVYVDGVADGAVPASGTIDPAKYWILMGRAGNDWPLIGLLSDVRIYSRALTTDEIVTISKEPQSLPPAVQQILAKENALAQGATKKSGTAVSTPPIPAGPVGIIRGSAAISQPPTPLTPGTPYGMMHHHYDWNDGTEACGPSGCGGSGVSFGLGKNAFDVTHDQCCALSSIQIYSGGPTNLRVQVYRDNGGGNLVLGRVFGPFDLGTNNLPPIDNDKFDGVIVTLGGPCNDGCPCGDLNLGGRDSPGGQPQGSSSIGTGNSASEDGTVNAQTSDGVDSARGASILRANDFAPIQQPGGTRSATLAFGRAQASDNPQSLPLGSGWTHNYNVWLTDLSNQVVVADWNGSQHAYSLSNSAYYGDGFAQLSKSGSNFVWQLRHGTTYNFDAANSNRLSTIVDRIGRAATLTYSNTVLSTIGDGLGRQLTLRYTNNNQIAQVIDPLSRIVNYNYLSNQLISVTDSLGTRAVYAYAGTPDGNGATSVTDARGNAHVYTYDSNGKATNEVAAVGGREGYAWNEAARSVTLTDWRGFTVTHTHDTNGALVTSVDNAGTITYGRDSLKRLTSLTDRLGKTSQYFYTPAGCGCSLSGSLSMLIDPLLRTNSWTYSTNFFFATSFTNAAGNVALWTYDSKGNVTTNTDAAIKTTIYGYDANGNRTSLKDANLNVTTFAYDGYGNRTNITDALTHTTFFTYDLVGRMLARTDALSRKDSFTWDTRDRLTSWINGAGATNRWNYDGNGNVTVWTNELRYARTYAFDVQNRLTTINLPSTSAFLKFGYDAGGNLTNVTDALSHSTQFGYDALSRLTAVTNALGKAWQFTVDAEGRRNKVTDPNTHANSFVYDAVGQVTAWTNALNKVATFQYDKLGNLTQVTDARLNPLAFGYDAVSRLTSITYTNTQVEKFAYDPVGNLTSFTNRAGQVVSLTYDVANRLTLKQYKTSGGTVTDTISFGYDNANQMTSAVWMAGATLKSLVNFSYDSAGRVINEVQQMKGAGLISIPYTYFDDGRRASVTTPLGTKAVYTYNSNGWLTAIAKNGSPNSPIVTYSYDAAGRRTLRVVENKTQTVYGYDNADQLTNIWHQYVSGNTTNTISQYKYGYDAGGNRTWVKQTTPANGYATTKGEVYRYDAADQVTNVLYNATNPDTTPSAWSNDVRYALDAAGNRTSVVTAVTGVPTNTTNYTANNLNQYTAVGGTNYTYDLDGNLTGDGVWTYSYDAENHLTNAVSGANSIYYTYDAFGRMVLREGSNTRRLYYAGWQLLEQRDGAGGTVGQYLWGTGIDEPFWIHTQTVPHYAHSDGLGNVTEITGSSGGINESYTYDVYGAVTIRNANGVIITTTGVDNSFMFTGHDRDPDTGLYNCRYRYYSPALGRFMQPDPIGIMGRDLNAYRYVWNDPTDWVDSYGLESVAIVDAKDKGNGHAPAGSKPPEGLVNWPDRVADQREFAKAGATTCDYVLHADNPSDAAKKLKGLQGTLRAKGKAIDELYFFDHGASGQQQVGVEDLVPKSATWKGIAGSTSPNAKIHFRGCCVGADQNILQDFANQGGRTVDAYTGKVNYDTDTGKVTGTGSLITKVPTSTP